MDSSGCQNLPEKTTTIYHGNHSSSEMCAASPAPAYGISKTAAKQTIQNSSLDEFATMLFSVAANLKTENKLTTEEKIAQFEVYAKLAEAEMEIVNGDKGIDAFELLNELRGRNKYGK